LKTLQKAQPKIAYPLVIRTSIPKSKMPKKYAIATDVVKHVLHTFANKGYKQ
jgi:hypothetical protein